jgi:hypothetical protein
LDFLADGVTDTVINMVVNGTMVATTTVETPTLMRPVLAAGCYRGPRPFEKQGARYSRRITKTQRVTKNEPFVNPLIVVIRLIASEYSAGFS